MSDDPITPDVCNAILRDLARARAAFQQRTVAAILTERQFGEPAKQPATPAPATGGYGDATKARDKT
jgi:hypothetical protein